ncbi:Hypothetical predicted protein [Octopus vulgaris]|uniref:Uncharacterized protein n=1 Tax=Octopus vulgaris TaxID=6645 RepID=A0AA36FGY0_OCTVU|nr:Hypothetical predicted protein [Octopus vulgaris]
MDSSRSHEIGFYEKLHAVPDMSSLRSGSSGVGDDDYDFADGDNKCVMAVKKQRKGAIVLRLNPKVIDIKMFQSTTPSVSLHERITMMMVTIKYEEEDHHFKEVLDSQYSEKIRTLPNL